MRTNKACRQSLHNRYLQIKLRNSTTSPRDQTSRPPKLKMRVAPKLPSQKVVSHFQPTTINHNLARGRSRVISAMTIIISNLIGNSIKIGTGSSKISNTITKIIDLKTTKGAEEANIRIKTTVKQAAVVITHIVGTQLWANNQTYLPICKRWRKWPRSLMSCNTLKTCRILTERNFKAYSCSWCSSLILSLIRAANKLNSCKLSTSLARWLWVCLIKKQASSRSINPKHRRLPQVKLKQQRQRRWKVKRPKISSLAICVWNIFPNRL